MDPIKVSQNSVLHVKSSFFQIISVNFKAGIGEGTNTYTEFMALRFLFKVLSILGYLDIPTWL
jgi:hypothetical protein